VFCCSAASRGVAAEQARRRDGEIGADCGRMRRPARAPCRKAAFRARFTLFHESGAWELPSFGRCCIAQITPPMPQHIGGSAWIGPCHEEITMAFEAFLLSRYVPFVGDVPEAAFRKPPRRGFFTHVLDAVVESRHRQAEREIARFLELRGGKFTDETDRLIGERLR
jgi:hypothetical protein